MAIAAVVTLIGVGLAVSSAAVVATNAAIGGTTRDENSKDALAAADAAAQIALFRQNQVDTNVSNPCVVEGAGGDLFAGAPDPTDDWCPQVSGEVGDATWTYRTSQAELSADGLTKEFSVVATGDASGITRRIEVSSSTPVADAVFASNSVVGRDQINLDSNSTIFGNAATNGSIILNSNSALCGAAQHGATGDVFENSNGQHGGASCPQSTYPETIGSVDLPPVDPALLANATSTSRFFAPQVSDGDTISGSTSEVSWIPPTAGGSCSARCTLTIDNNSALTLGGTDYRLCQLTLKSNSVLYVAEGAQVRIFFDTPENCGLSSGAAQIMMDSNTRVSPTSGDPSSLALIVLGSDTQETRVELDSNTESTMPMVVYAPRSAVDIDSNATYIGAIAGKTIDINSNASINSDPSANDFQLPVLLQYTTDRYVECSSTPGTSPDDYC